MRARPLVTPARAGAALAGGVHPDAPEKPHLCVPQALTQASRKSSPKLLNTLTRVSRMSSPTRPADPHRCAPERLTGASRRYSPATPGKAHRGLPDRLTKHSRISSPQPSRRSSPAAPEKSHLLGKFEFSSVEYGGKCVRTPRRKPRRGTGIAASGTLKRYASRVPNERRYFRCKQVPARSRLLRSGGRLECSAFLILNSRNALGGRRHRLRATSPCVRPPAHATAAASS